MFTGKDDYPYLKWDSIKPSPPKPLTDREAELAARFLCERQGLDPDAAIGTGSGFLKPRWMVVAEEIRHSYDIRIAIEWGIFLAGSSWGEEQQQAPDDPG